MGLEPQPIETRGRTRTTPSEKRKAAISVADRIAREYPHQPGDEINAGRRLAYHHQARPDLLELLAQLGLNHDDIRRTP